MTKASLYVVPSSLLPPPLSHSAHSPEGRTRGAEEECRERWGEGKGLLFVLLFLLAAVGGVGGRGSRAYTGRLLPPPSSFERRVEAIVAPLSPHAAFLLALPPSPSLSVLCAVVVVLCTPEKLLSLSLSLLLPILPLSRRRREEGRKGVRVTPKEGGRVRCQT